MLSTIIALWLYFCGAILAAMWTRELPLNNPSSMRAILAVVLWPGLVVCVLCLAIFFAGKEILNVMRRKPLA